MLPLSLRSNTGSFKPSQMPTSSCGRNSSRSVVRKRCHIYWRLVIHTLYQGCQPQKNKPQKPASQCPNYTHSHLPSHDNCPAWNAICKTCSKKGHWHASATVLVLLANNPLSPMELRRPPIINAMERERKWIEYRLTPRRHPHVMSYLSMQLIVELQEELTQRRLW